MTTAEPTPPMPDPFRCPQCGAPLGGGALAGLCPACLLQQGAADSVTGAEAHGFEPPSVAELAPLFPQLEIFALIGHGGMGAVYQARQRELDRVVALKILPPALGDAPGFADRFSREARALAKLNHPGIVAIHEFGRADGLFYFLMEFVDGVNLRQLLAGGRISPREALAIVPEICDALQFAHDHGIVHRDIKPANILLDRRGRVKVADFGLAKLIEAGADETASEGRAPARPGAGPAGAGPSDSAAASKPALTRAGKVLGTPSYMAPEQTARPEEVDHRADIYALGVVFYQMLTGELPSTRLQPPSRKVRVDEIVLSALEEQPELRYQQAGDMRTAVETLVSTPSAEPSPGSLAPTRKALSKTGLWLVAPLILAALAFWWVAPRFHGTAAREQRSSGKSPWTLLDSVAGRAKSAFEQWQPTKIASVDPETGALVVKSSDGGSFRILAVSSADQPAAWWRPDGKPLTGQTFEVRGQPKPGKDHFLLFDYRSAHPSVQMLGTHVSSYEPAGEHVYSSL